MMKSKTIIKGMTFINLLCLPACETHSSQEDGHRITEDDTPEESNLPENSTDDGTVTMDNMPKDDSTTPCPKASPVALEIFGGVSIGIEDEVAKSTVKISGASAVCTGTIIGNKHVLTAAHCLPLSESDYIGFGKNGEDDRINIAGSVAHPEYPNFEYGAGSDIAIILLQNEIPSYAKPVELDSPQPCQSIIQAGYGLTREEELGVLHKVEVLVRDVRNKEFKSSVNPSKGICFGDSGGPSFIKNSDGLRVVGVNSGIDFSIESEGCGPGLNINAKSQESWINQAIEDLEKGN